MKRALITALSIVLLLSGCAGYFGQQEPVTVPSDNNTSRMYQSATMKSALVDNNESSFRGYARDLVAELALTMKSVKSTGTIAVTNFVMASDAHYQSTNALGFTMAEAFMTELHQFGLTTIDFKVADYIRVTPKGDFVMSRDYLELKNTIPADYVLVGTFSPLRRGYMIYARIVDMQSKVVLATSESFMPSKEVNMLLVDRTPHMTRL